MKGRTMVFPVAALAAITAMTQSALGEGAADIFFPPAAPAVIQAITEEIGGPGPTTVSATRSAIVGGACSVTVNVTSCRPDLQQVRFLVATDADASGTIEAAEWSLVASATGVVNGTTSSAALSVGTVSAGYDAYRVEHTWAGFGVAHDDVKRLGIE